MTDFRVDNHGSIFILNALTPAALQWADDHLPDDRQLWGWRGTVIEPRYVSDIVDAIRNEGLTIA
jgi:hypothetical protein